MQKRVHDGGIVGMSCNNIGNSDNNDTDIA